ncbi:MAG: hypothetical protein JKX91_06425 [Rhizobiaceae bacterium]|nr:hypothetical protein [Rhizobiaceae bacterium]
MMQVVMAHNTDTDKWDLWHLFPHGNSSTTYSTDDLKKMLTKQGRKIYDKIDTFDVKSFSCDMEIFSLKFVEVEDEDTETLEQSIEGTRKRLREWKL